jgi:hypothetical protein
MTVLMLKYSIPVQSMSTVMPMRTGVVVKCVGVQCEGEVCLWAEVPHVTADQGVWEEREFVTIGTGQEVLGNWTYVGTAFDGAFVWHVYEVTA